MKQEVMIVTGAGQIGMDIARRMGYGKKIVLGDRKEEHAQKIAGIMNEAGFDVLPVVMDLASKDSIVSLIGQAKIYGDITMFVNAAGVSPSQASIETILKVDLYGTAALLEEMGEAIAPGGMGVTISSQSGHRMKQLTPKEDELLACTPANELLSLDIDEFQGPRGDFYKNMFAKCPAGRPGTADEVANVAELLMSEKGAFITGADFLIDGGATASYFYGPLRP